MSIIRDFFVKEKPVFTGIARGLGGFGFGSAGGGSAAPVPWTATGGAKMTSGDYVYHIWVDGFAGSDQNFVVTGDGSKTVNYSVVAGGGGGGSGNTGNGSNYLSGGGGGGGGLRTGSAAVSAGTYPVTMGTGGAGADNVPNGVNLIPTIPGYGAKGNNTVFGLSTPVVATGGGAGENRGLRDPATGGVPSTPAPGFINGGSGGGSSNGPPTNGPPGNALASPDGISPTDQGYNGGRDNPTGPVVGAIAGGGGGAGSEGGNGSPTSGGVGGNGAPTIFPGPFMYPLLPSPYQSGLGNAWKDALAGDGSLGGGGGAGEGTSNNPGAPGPGGGGAGGEAPGNPNGNGGNGVTGTGGGGGGGDSEGTSNNAHGGTGGPGCIMIRYPSA
jgi:hypothetical protein